ncbi:MAG: (4Fe-4S)-binding protein [Sedimenticola sp.]|nr:(4Fe-4S)-binding protein [Sedimenticola sp.]
MIKVTWNKAACTHAGVCVKTLPDVFKVEHDQLVIRPNADDEKKIAGVCSACPSGALHVVRD